MYVPKVEHLLDKNKYVNMPIMVLREQSHIILTTYFIISLARDPNKWGNNTYMYQRHMLIKQEKTGVLNTYSRT